jgi:hypothetical protein
MDARRTDGPRARRGRRGCPFCDADLDPDGTCARCGHPGRGPRPTGWRPDPTARHEGRFYTAGRPTNRVRNGARQTTDAAGARLLPDHVDLPPARSVRATWLATGALTVIVVVTTLVVWALMVGSHRPATPPDAAYLLALKDDGVFDQFRSESDAVAHGRQVCDHLAGGGPRQGVLADKLAVDAFCPQFTADFRILEKITATGIFEVDDHAGAGTLETDGSSCHGAGGYSDVGSSTPVNVTNERGEVLAVTALGQGTGDATTCTFRFSFPVTEGQERYVVSVGHRGTFPYSFEQLQSRGAQIRLGE